MDKNSSTISEPQIMRGCAALSQDVALELIDSTPGWFVKGLEKEGLTMQILTAQSQCNCY